VRTREIKEKQIRFHPDRNKLLQVIGVPWTETPYEFSDSYSTNSFDAFLLCTDGFWELITEKEMCKCLKKSATPEEWIAKMEHIVCENGQGKEMDNYSAIAVFTEK
jgi:serine/threonine protein phosphatase PrpC